MNLAYRHVGAVAKGIASSLKTAAVATLALLFGVTLPAWAGSPTLSELAAQIAALQNTVDVQAATIGALQQTVKTEAQQTSTTIGTLQNTVSGQATQITHLQQYADPLAKVLTYNPTNNLVQFTGVNLQIVNGTNHTSMIDANATGNLIIGYNEDDGHARGTCTVSSSGLLDTLEDICIKDGG